MDNEEIFALVDGIVLAALHNIVRELTKRKVFVDAPFGRTLTAWRMTVYKDVRVPEPRPDDLAVDVEMFEDGDDVLLALSVRRQDGAEVAGIGPVEWASRDDREAVLDQARFYLRAEVTAEVVGDILGYIREPIGPKEWSPRWPRRRKPEMGVVGPKEWAPRMWIAVKVNTGHSKMGNPRRGWVVIDHRSGEMLDFVDEGYEGIAVLRRAYPQAVEGPEMIVTPGQYRDLVRFGKERAERHRRGGI